MTTKLARNPRRRNVKLSRNQKIGVALVSVAAVGGITATVIALRRKPKRDTPICPPLNGQPQIWNAETQQCEPIGGQGSGAPGSSGVSRGTALGRAKRRMCLNPGALTLEQRLLLQEDVFLPLLLALPSPSDYDNVAVIRDAALEALCAGTPSPAAVAIAAELAQRTWENYTGFGG